MSTVKPLFFVVPNSIDAGLDEKNGKNCVALRNVVFESKVSLI